MLPRAGIDKKTDQKVFFFCTITEIFPKIVKNIIIFIEILRFCFFLNILPETFIKFSRENWIRTRYLDTELIRSVGPGNGGWAPPPQGKQKAKNPGLGGRGRSVDATGWSDR